MSSHWTCMTETVLFNREYSHLSLFYLTFTLFFFAWYCKTFLDGMQKLYKWKKIPNIGTLYFFLWWVHSKLHRYGCVHARAWHFFTQSLVTRQANMRSCWEKGASIQMATWRDGVHKKMLGKMGVRRKTSMQINVQREQVSQSEEIANHGHWEGYRPKNVPPFQIRNKYL